MLNLKVLLTGDYWHTDFRNLIGAATFPITLQPFDCIDADVLAAECYDIVVVAQSRRGQFEATAVEEMVTKFVNTPVVSLCGSWCEGESRSGSPVPGLLRVYWHQWQGQLENFIDQLESKKIATWQAPKIASIPDLVLYQMENLTPRKFDHRTTVGISTYTSENFLTLQDGLKVSNFKTCWIECIDANDIDNVRLSAICVEGNSLTDSLQQRIGHLQQQFPLVPIVLILNFPRSDEFALARQLGITEIVSKPFQLCDLSFAIERLLPAVKAA